LQNCFIYRRRVSESFAKTQQGNKRECSFHNVKETRSKWRPEITIIFVVKNALWLKESGLTSITLDADSPRKISLRLSKAILRGETVKSVCGNQEGAAKGFNTTKKGVKSFKWN